MLADVVMPVKNGELYIEAAIEGLQRQSERDWRVFVIDHQSTDQTVSIIERLAKTDTRIALVDGSAAHSLSAVRNLGLKLCEAPLILLHDADDVSKPDRIVTSLRGFDAHPDAVAIGGQSDVIDATGRHIGRRRRHVDKAQLSAASLFCNPISQPTVAFRKDALDRHGVSYGVNFLDARPGGDEEIVPTLVEDYLLFGQLAMTGGVVNLPSTLIDYRLHNSNISNVNKDNQLSASLFVSRFLVRALSKLKDKPYADPALLCNHCGQLFDVSRQGGWRSLYDTLANLVRSAFGLSESVERELAYRYTIATRNAATMALRYVSFRMKHSPEMDEDVALREWFLGPLRGRPHTEAPRDDHHYEAYVS